MRSSASFEQDWRAEKRARIDAVFAESERVGVVQHRSPSGRYELEVVSWQRTKGWTYAEGIVRRVHDGDPIAVIQRNYPAFPFTWCEGHPNGHDYLVAGEDYQGQTVIELDTGGRADHLPDEAEQGHGFCWAAHYLSSDKTLLVIDGCIWAGPYELVAFDFTRLLALPYPELHRWTGDLGTVDGFDDTGTLSWTFTVDVRMSDGKPCAELTDDEDAELLDDTGKYRPDAFGTHTYRARWRHGEPFASTTSVRLGAGE